MYSYIGAEIGQVYDYWDIHMHEVDSPNRCIAYLWEVISSLEILRPLRNASKDNHLHKCGGVGDGSGTLFTSCL